MPLESTSRGSTQQRHWFTTTHWSVVLAARRSDSTRGQAALGTLCQTYWYPLYAFTRRFGHGPHDAQDLVQSFFERCLEKNYLADADRGKGRFRSFLLLALKRFLANEWDKASARKRGGGKTPISLDALTAEERYALEPVDRMSADRLYERRWAMTLLEHVLARLRQEHASNGRLPEFEQLKACLTAGRGATPYADLAARLGTTEGAVKVAIHRMRKRYRELLEEEIAHTVSSPDEIESERKDLLSALAD